MKSVQIRSFFWSLFSCTRIEYGDLLRKSPYSVRIQENTDQKKLRIGTLFTQCRSLIRLNSLNIRSEIWWQSKTLVVFSNWTNTCSKLTVKTNTLEPLSSAFNVDYEEAFAYGQCYILLVSMLRILLSPSHNIFLMHRLV